MSFLDFRVGMFSFFSFCSHLSRDTEVLIIVFSSNLK